MHSPRMTAYTRGMSTARTRTPSPWPDKPLIRITRGRSKDAPVEDVLARKACSGGVYIEVGGAGRDISRGCFRDSIDSWEEVAIVPAQLLRDLGEALEGLDELSPGAGADGRTIAAGRAVLAHLPDA